MKQYIITYRKIGNTYGTTKLRAKNVPDAQAKLKDHMHRNVRLWSAGPVVIKEL